MQLFPTTFWRPGLTESPVEGDSCYELVNVSALSEDDNSYKLDTATTPDGEGDDGVGLYKDYLFSEMVVSEQGLPFTHLNRADGKRTQLGIYDEDYYRKVDKDRDDNTSPDGFVYATQDWRSTDLTWEGWEAFSGEIDEFSDPDLSILDHWLYIWTEQPTFQYPLGVTNDLHKTSPVTISSSADCKTATITCYFEKDVTQKLFELTEGPASAIGGSKKQLAKDYDYPTAESLTVNKFVSWGFNGSRQASGTGGPWDVINFSYRQKAKARLRFTLGSTKNLTIKIKGLGTDYHDQFSKGTQLDWSFRLSSDSVTDKKYFFFDEGPTDQMKRGLYAITPDLILREKQNLKSIYAQPGDVQSCTIFFDDEEKIKCVAPVLNYFQSSLVVDLNYPNHPEQLKGPVRIFEHKGTSSHEDDNATIKNYEGVGSSSHPVEGLGYIEESEYPDGYGYSRWLESDTIINPYGELWTQEQSYFYDGGSDMVTPDYSSPYQYTHTLENVSAGEHTIDVVFDSVAEIFNGGAYYEIEISHT